MSAEYFRSPRGIHRAERWITCKRLNFSEELQDKNSARS